jgi:hypothetical protein
VCVSCARERLASGGLLDGAQRDGDGEHNASGIITEHRLGAQHITVDEMTKLEIATAFH